MTEVFAGLMSGTSLDGVDGVLVDFEPRVATVLCHVSAPLPPGLKDELLQLNASGPDELHRAALAANALVRVYAEVVERLLTQSGRARHAIRAIGAHGQTVRHRPQLYDGTGYTVQLNQPALLAELCGIDVVADFRSRDVAAGGQGAPLVPPFHHALFGGLPGCSGVLNIGGISNISLLNTSAAQSVSGFDCGPGNALMDAWCLQHTGQAYDNLGQWAASGAVNTSLLHTLLGEPFFEQPPPKSTGRDLFNRSWLQAHLRGFEDLRPQDVQATLTELTALACASCVKRFAPHCERLIVCGGGALNRYLMSRLQDLLAPCAVADSASFGMPALHMEAAAFAWLARQCLRHQTASLQSVTGARGARILGAIYPA